MSWHAGDLALIVDDGGFREETKQCIGSECRLASYLGHYVRADHAFGVANAWKVYIGTHPWAVNESALRKPYDGNELYEWSDVIWQPKELVVTN